MTDTAAAATSRRPRGLAISWFFAPYVGSADVDFFRRIKDLDADFDVLQVKRAIRDDRLLAFDHRRNLRRFEIEVDHLRPRSAAARDGFLKACLEHYQARAGEYDFVISHSNEVHCHRVAWEIRRRSGLPWIAYFGDPSAKNPYVRYMRDYPYWQEDNESERIAFEQADRLVFNNEYQRRLMLEGFEQHAAKSRVIAHAFDPEMYSAQPAARSTEKFLLGHFGTLYSVKRKAEVLFRGIDRLLQIYPEYRDRFLVELYGSTTALDLAAHSAMRHRDHVAFRGQVGYVESLAKMCEMDALVLIDAFFSVEEDGLAFSPFLPCKLADYLGAKKPIVGITMKDGPCADILRASGNLVADERTDRVAYVLKRYIDRKVSLDYTTVAARYSHERQVAQMQQLVDELLSEKAAACTRKSA
ncbi:MAG: hypothetical protein ACOX6T_11660 [Myxococcales bacterium]|jgi:glycosyltransferase involved in cell wall biosynthesis